MLKVSAIKAFLGCKYFAMIILNLQLEGVEEGKKDECFVIDITESCNSDQRGKDETVMFLNACMSPEDKECIIREATETCDHFQRGGQETIDGLNETCIQVRDPLTNSECIHQEVDGSTDSKIDKDKRIDVEIPEDKEFAVDKVTSKVVETVTSIFDTIKLKKGILSYEKNIMLRKKFATVIYYFVFNYLKIVMYRVPLILLTVPGYAYKSSEKYGTREKWFMQQKRI